MSQASSLLDLLSDKEPHRTDEILEVVYGGSHLGLARVGARVFDLKKKGYEIAGWKDKENTTLYWYRLVKNPTEAVETLRPIERTEVSTPAELFSFKKDPIGRIVAV